MQHTVEQLSVDWACDLVGPAGCASHLSGMNGIVELPGGMVPFLLRAAVHLALRTRGADLVLASSGVMAPLAWLAARRSACPYVVWIHGLDIVYGNAVYRALALPAIRAAHRVVANSRHTAQLAIAAGIDQARIRVIHPGVEAAGAIPETATRDFAARRGLADHPLMLFVGRLIERKGVVEFVEYVLPTILRSCPEARFLVIGAEPGYGDRPSGPYRERIRAAAMRAGVGPAVLLAGELPDEELQLAYATADVLAFPVIECAGDVEGFGMAAVEAAAHGTPTVAFAVGGVPDAVSADNGVLVRPGDYAGMAAAILGVLRETGAQDSAQRCREHAQACGWDRYGAAVRAVCREAAGIAP